MNEYNSISKNQQRLMDISLDDVSGIDTMVNNMSKSSNLTIVSPSFQQEPAIISPPKQTSTNFLDNFPKTLPSVDIIPLAKQDEQKQNVIQKINNLEDDTKVYIIIGLFALSAVLFLITILK